MAVPPPAAVEPAHGPSPAAGAGRGAGVPAPHLGAQPLRRLPGRPGGGLRPGPGRAHGADRRQRADLPRPRCLHGGRRLHHGHAAGRRAGPLGLAVAASTATSALLGLIVGLPATRLRGPYLAGLTLALAVGLPQVSVRFAHVFGGEEGISVPPPTPPDGVDPQRWLAWICLLTTLVVLVLLANLMSSNVGRAFRSVRDDEVAAALAGIHIGRTKVLCFTVSAACAGLSGGLLGLGTAIVNPGEFAPALSIGLLAGMVLGGSGSLLGAWWGAVFLVYVPQWATSVSGSLHLSSSVSSNLALVVYGLVLIGVVMAAPAGVQGGLRRLVAALAPRLRPGPRAS